MRDTLSNFRYVLIALLTWAALYAVQISVERGAPGFSLTTGVANDGHNTPISLPYRAHQPDVVRRHASLSFRFTLAGSESSYALLFPFIQDSAQVYVNQRLLGSVGHIDQDPTRMLSRNRFRPVLLELPPSALFDGENQLRLEVVSTGAVKVPPIQVGHYADLLPSYQFMRVIRLDTVAVGQVLLLATAVIIFLLAASTRLDTRLATPYWWLALACLGLAIHLGHYTVLSLPISQRTWWIYSYGSLLLFVISLAAFSLAEQPDKQRQWLLALLGVGAILGVGLIYSSLYAEYALMWRFIRGVFEPVLFAIAIPTVIKLALRPHHGAKIGQAVLAVCLWVLLIESAWEMSRLEAFASNYLRQFHLASVVALLALAWLLIKPLLTLNQTLQHEKQRLEHEYDIASARIIELHKDKTANDAKDAERQRIVEELHDSVTPDINWLIHHSSEGTISPEELHYRSRRLRSDLRLIIDSMQNVDPHVGVALGSLRRRLEDLIPDERICLHWHAHAIPYTLIASPRRNLDLQRIIQESVHNAIRHADADNITVSMECDHDTKALRLEVKDDGRGFLPDTHSIGHGTRNIQRRAQRIGAELRWERACDDAARPGTVLIINWPVQHFYDIGKHDSAPKTL